MKKTSRFIGAWMLTVLLLLSLAGCGASESTSGTTSGNGSSSEAATGASQGATSLEVWTLETTPQRVEAYQDVIDGFMAENPDISVELKVINWAEAFPKLLTSIQGGTGPDVVQCSPDITITVKELGVVQPMDEVVEKIKSEYGLYEAPIVPYSYDDHVWAVPVWTQSMMLYYRADLLEEAGLEPPETWDELLNAASVLTTDDRYGIGIPTSKNMYADQVFYSFMTTAGADVYDYDGNPCIDSPETLKTLEFYQQLAQYTPQDSSSWTWNESEQALAADKIAMTVAFGNVLERAYRDAPEIAESLESVPLPIPEGGQAGTITYSIALMCLAQDEEKIEASKEFIEYAHRPDVNAAWLNKMAPGCFLPCTDATAQSEEFLSDDIVKTFTVAIENEIKASQSGKMFGFTSENPVEAIGSVTGANIISEMNQQVTFGSMEPAEAAAEAQSKIESFQ